MNKDAQIKALLEEANNAKAWFVKYADELKNDPSNERFLRLHDLCRQEFEPISALLGALPVGYQTSTYRPISLFGPEGA